MAFSEELAGRVRAMLSDRGDVTEKRMFGGLAFMISGNMCCGVVGEMLMLRVGPDQYVDALAQPFVREMDFTGKPMKGMVYVEPHGIQSDNDLRVWISWGERFAASLPPK